MERFFKDARTAERFGSGLEPAYDYSFARGHQKSLGISFGLLIGLR